MGELVGHAVGIAAAGSVATVCTPANQGLGPGGELHLTRWRLLLATM